jgi:hypothetical protein
MGIEPPARFDPFLKPDGGLLFFDFEPGLDDLGPGPKLDLTTEVLRVLARLADVLRLRPRSIKMVNLIGKGETYERHLNCLRLLSWAQAATLATSSSSWRLIGFSAARGLCSRTLTQAVVGASLLRLQMNRLVQTRFRNPEAKSRD